MQDTPEGRSYTVVKWLTYILITLCLQKVFQICDCFFLNLLYFRFTVTDVFIACLNNDIFYSRATTTLVIWLVILKQKHTQWTYSRTLNHSRTILNIDYIIIQQVITLPLLLKWDPQSLKSCLQNQHFDGRQLKILGTNLFLKAIGSQVPVVTAVCILPC